MTSRAAHIIAALRAGHDDLVAALGKLGPDEIRRTSGSRDWTVAAVVSHLGSGAEITAATLKGAVEGTGNPGMDFNKTVWARWDAMSPEDQVASFPAVDEQLVRAFEALDEQALADLRIDVGFMPAPLDVAGHAGMRLSEFALHAWDVAVAFDPAAVLRPDAAELLVDTFAPLLGFAGKAHEIEGSVAIAVHATDPERSLGLSIADSVSMTDVPDAPDATFSTPTEYLVRLVSGRNAPEHTPDSVQVTGAVTLDDLRRVFPGY
jgi:uncharacterized protein (TIGR03083 family)